MIELKEKIELIKKGLIWDNVARGNENLIRCLQLQEAERQSEIYKVIQSKLINNNDEALLPEEILYFIMITDDLSPITISHIQDVRLVAGFPMIRNLQILQDVISSNSSNVKLHLDRRIEDENKIFLNLPGLCLSGTDLTCFRFFFSNLEASDLSSAKIEGLDVSYSNLTKANLNNATTEAALPQQRHGCSFVHTRAHKAILDFVYLYNGRLDFADFFEASCIKATLDYTGFDGAQFIGANLEDATLRNAGLQTGHGYNFEKAYVVKTVFKGFYFRFDVNFNDAQFLPPDSFKSLPEFGTALFLLHDQVNAAFNSQELDENQRYSRNYFLNIIADSIIKALSLANLDDFTKLSFLDFALRFPLFEPQHAIQRKLNTLAYEWQSFSMRTFALPKSSETYVGSDAQRKFQTAKNTLLSQIKRVGFTC